MVSENSSFNRARLKDSLFSVYTYKSSFTETIIGYTICIDHNCSLSELNRRIIAQGFS